MQASSRTSCKGWNWKQRNEKLFEVAICDLKHSSIVSWNMKSSGKRSMLRLTCSFSRLVSTPYNSARSRSIITCLPLSVRMRFSMGIANWSQYVTGSLFGALWSGVLLSCGSFIRKITQKISKYQADMHVYKKRISAKQQSGKSHFSHPCSHKTPMAKQTDFAWPLIVRYLR